MEEQMSRYKEGDDMVAAVKEQHSQFNSLETGVDKLEAIASATEITVIPRATPRKRSGKAWVKDI
jgi:hypothetical protein